MLLWSLSIINNNIIYSVNYNDRILGFWAIRSDEKVGFSKLFRQNFPTNQIDTLQILINGGVATSLVIKDITGEIWFTLQILWEKEIAQKDLRFAIRSILSKLGIGIKIEMAIISIVKNINNTNETKNFAMDIFEPDEQQLKDKIEKWKMVKKWNDSLENQWLKYGEINPKYMVTTDRFLPYNIIKEFSQDSTMNKIIEVMIWTPKDITDNIDNFKFERFPNDLKINKGNNNNNLKFLS